MAARLLVLPLAVAAALALAAPAGSHPGHGPPTIAIANLAYSPADITVYAGDAVLWVWSGPDTNHSVTGDGFDSDAGKAPSQIEHKVNDSFAHSYARPGTYAFHCRVHSFMHGTVTVQPAPAADPSANAAPVISRLRATRSGRRVVLSFSLSSPADLRATLRRGGHNVKEVDFGAPPGSTRRKVSFGRLRPGRYTVRLVAVDRGSGQSSKAASAVLRVKA